ncbi:MalY/PatB family protein [Janibacter sp. G1551]|uniref:MalY/PatB family protein n=1 Tax=Janibacter sp. G1551 TaxID=3420440 RepID=UPI003D0192F8
MTRRILNQPLETLRRRTSVKWMAYPADVLPLWVAEMDVATVPAVADAMTTAMELGDTGYSWPADYLRAVSAFAADRWGWQADPARARLVPDVMIGITETLRAIGEPGDAVVINPPVYEPFWTVINATGRALVEAPLGADDRLDLAVLERAYETAAGLGAHPTHLLCSPHNPTGTVHTAAELVAVMELARAYGVQVVVDEIHAPVVRPGVTHTPLLSLPEGAAAVSLLSASKGWNLAGFKAAALVAGPDAHELLASVPADVSYGASHLATQAQAAAFDRGREWLDILLLDLEDNRHLLGELLPEHLPAVRWSIGDGTYFAWLDCRDLGLGDDPARTFLDRGRVALSSGTNFGTGGAGFARLNLATSPEILTEAVRRMAAAGR